MITLDSILHEKSIIETFIIECSITKKKKKKKKKYGCSCKNKKSYLLRNNCLTPKIIYEVTVTNNTDNEKWIYFDNSDTTFKKFLRIQNVYK